MQKLFEIDFDFRILDFQSLKSNQF